MVPELGTTRASDVLPMFDTVTVFGLSVLVDPTLVAAKVREGASARSILKIPSSEFAYRPSLP